MEQPQANIIEQIPPEDWAQTPASVKKLVELMAERIELLEQQAVELLFCQQQLLEKVNKTSKNSSSPPSSDPPGFGQKTRKKSGKKRGGQSGHEGKSRNLYPIEKCHEVIDHHPIALADLFGISISLGTVNKLRLEASNAVADSVAQAKLYIQQQEIVAADETSFNQANIDGGNPQQRQAWLWVAVTPQVTFFEIALTRCTAAAQNLLGENFGGILTSDRFGAYNWVDIERRQLCWAHLKREFIKISERPGVSASVGTQLLQQQEKLFKLWQRVRDGTLSRNDFAELIKEIRHQTIALLQQTADFSIGSKEKTPLAKTVRTCRQLLSVESAMWLFATTPGLEPTNNAAERAIRPAVIWRRTSFGSQTTAGSTFVSRMLTVVTTLKSQQRNILEFITTAVANGRENKPAPSLLPSV